MEWEKLFEPYILERGYDYFENNFVKDMEISADFIRANVIGRNKYDVEISLFQDKINDIYCSCPYAEDGKNCKHMAAVLYEWSSRKADKKIEKEVKLDKNRENILKLIEQVDRDKILSFLADILIENEKLFLRFNTIVHKDDTKGYVVFYQKQIDDIVNKYLDRNHFINYYMADNVISELEEIIDKYVLCLIKDENYRSAFDILNYMFIVIGNTDIDDSNGGISLLADEIYENWLDILSKVKAQDKSSMFEWFISSLDASVIGYMEEYIEQIIMEGFREKEYREAKLEFINKKIEESNKEQFGWVRNYDLGKWATRYLNLLEEDAQYEQKCLNFCKKYWNNSSVRDYYIDFCIRKKDYEQALHVLEENIVMCENKIGSLSNYSRKKKDIFLLQGNKQSYVNELWKLVMEYTPGNLNFFNELKKQYTKEEWFIKREKILKKLSKHACVAALYKEEKLYDRLLTFVLESRGLYLVEEYEKDLLKDYPKQILNKYEKELNEMSAHTSTRKNYRELVALLRKMNKMKGGKQVVEEICRQWKIKYKNRPAMMEELSKL